MKEPVRKKRIKSRQTKDRVLQARIPRDLDDELRDHAEQLGLSVSTVVRNVLLNTFQLVEGVVADSSQLARAIQGRKPRTLPRRAVAPDAHEDKSDERILGWQEAVLNINGTCDQCNCILRKGERAGVGVPPPARPVLLCLSCLAALSSADSDHPEESG